MPMMISWADISMTIPKRYNPSMPLCAVYKGAINLGEPGSMAYYRRMADMVLAEFTPGDNLAVDLSDYFYEANPFAGNDSMLAESIWAEAIRHYWLRATGQPIKEAPVPIPGWEQGRIDRLKARVKRLHGGKRVADMLGCKDMTIYQVLGENAYYTPGKRAEWLVKIEAAVNDIEGFRVYVKRMIERESDRRTA
ncbi:MAG: hypothetical protein WC455_27715 [Dehalococcoidia bacterium]